MRNKKSLLHARNKIAEQFLKDFFEMSKFLLSEEVEYRWVKKQSKYIRDFVKWFGLRWDRNIKYYFCRNCKNFMFKGLRVRVRNNRFRHISITCPNCGHIKRYRLEP